MQTLKTATVRLNAQETDYVRLLQNKHKEKYGVSLSQSDLFRLLLKKEAERLQVDKETESLKDLSLLNRIRSMQHSKKHK